eukprot:3235375-Heterocapsa_arctica.AAC.1
MWEDGSHRAVQGTVSNGLTPDEIDRMMAAWSPTSSAGPDPDEVINVGSMTWSPTCSNGLEPDKIDDE